MTQVVKLQTLLEEYSAFRKKEGGIRMYEHDFVRVIIRDAPTLLAIAEAAEQWRTTTCCTLHLYEL